MGTQARAGTLTVARIIGQRSEAEAQSVVARHDGTPFHHELRTDLIERGCPGLLHDHPEPPNSTAARTWPTQTVVWYVNEQVHQIHPFRGYPQVMTKAEELRERLMPPPD